MDNKRIVIPLLKTWRKKIATLEVALDFCSEHNFDLEAKRVVSNIRVLNNCKMELEELFKINESV